MATVNTTTTLDGFFKEVYANKLKDIRVKGYKFQNDIGFMSSKKRPGGQYNQPVQVLHEHGFTYSQADNGAFALNDPVAGGTKNATILGTQMLLRSRMDYETAARAASGVNAFKDATRLLVQEMVSAYKKRTEIELLYGQEGIGEVRATYTPGADQVVEIEEDEFASGIWAGMEGAEIEFYDGKTGTDTKHDGGHATGTATIESVDLVNKEITIASGFDVDDASLPVAAGDIIYFKGARTATQFNVFKGLHTILTTTAGTTLFGIDPADSSLWAPSQYAVGGDLTFAAVQQAVIVATAKGLDRDLTLYCSPRAWADLLDDEVAFRRWNDKKGGRYDVGGDQITFHSQNGSIAIKASVFVKEGYCYLIPSSCFKRIGATDWTFNLLGEDQGDRIFRHLEDSAGFELRTYCHQALFCDSPGHSVIMTGLTVPNIS